MASLSRPAVSLPDLCWFFQVMNSELLCIGFCASKWRCLCWHYQLGSCPAYTVSTVTSVIGGYVQDFLPIKERDEPLTGAACLCCMLLRGLDGSFSEVNNRTAFPVASLGLSPTATSYAFYSMGVSCGLGPLGLKHLFNSLSTTNESFSKPGNLYVFDYLAAETMLFY